MKKIYLTLTLFLLACTLAGCGKSDDRLDQYKADMENFTNTINELATSIDNIDVGSDSRVKEMLGYLDEMDAAFAAMGNLEVPEQFANIEELADDASANLSKSVSLYHQAFDDPEGYDPQLVNAALEYYSRAFKRLDYIGTILQGDLPEDESITIVHEEDGENTGPADGGAESPESGESSPGEGAESPENGEGGEAPQGEEVPEETTE